MKKNIIANLIGRFWGILSNFLFIPFYIKLLGFESYSIISFSLMIAGIMAVLDAGLTATLSREFARTDKNEEEKKKIFTTLETIYYILVVLCITIIFLFSKTIATQWINTPYFTDNQITYFLRILSFEVGFQLLLRFYLGGFLGLERQVEANLYQIAWGVVRNAIVLIPLYYFPQLDVFFIWQAVTTILFTILLKMILQKRLGNNMFSFKTKIDKGILKDVGSFAGGMMLIALVSILNTQLDKITISKLLSIENLGYYTLALALAQGLIILVNPFSAALLPRFTAFYSISKKKEASELFAKSSLIISVIIFTIMMVMSFFAKDIIWIWTGDKKIAEKSYHIVPIILLSYTMLALAILPYNIAIANGNTKFNNILGITSLVLTIPGYYIFTKKYGAMGAASVFCFVQIFVTLIYFYFINKKYLFLNFYIDIMLRRFIFPLLVIGLIVLCLAYIPNYFEDNRILSLTWIGLITFTTLILSLGILVPKTELFTLIKFKKIKN
ncbi:oligosaccharide flippase family protein [Chryseobacterium geocarposphaerae]|uniref:O-antigen/teichoic acid export membrane protein n=1 Tax=Chryseobacterium geocarposphaerae TaxID=1416776 RepID=A0A2M9CAF3_9FLAO|nr:oligosaccharide flippase family protein [Chryseobacterium geocarposphaerae]PJJ67828.1 O-antigen/teichoic acid export membrane protein [Chryseobacterium geocarposphaerae]